MGTAPDLQAATADVGGKAAIIQYVQQQLPALPVKPYVVWRSGSGIDSILPEFRQMQKPVIVRSSSPHEFDGFDGIFQSVPDVMDEAGLERALQAVEQSATSERAQEYARQNNITIDGRIHAMVQEQSDSRFCGAMMRHPNAPERLYIQYYSGQGECKRDHDTAVVEQETGKPPRVIGTMPEETALALAEKYGQIEACGIAPGRSVIVEFGEDPFTFYQARPFKKVEMAAFKLPYPENKRYRTDFLHGDLCFGLTKPEGIVLSVVRGLGYTEARVLTEELAESLESEGSIKFRGDDERLKYRLVNLVHAQNMSGWSEAKMANAIAVQLREHHQALDDEHETRYAFITSSAHREHYDVDLTMKKMQALMLGGAESFLVHDLVRLFRKAEVSIATSPPHLSQFFGQLQTGDKVRFICNGREGLVLRE
jgi:hypothetical protein